MDKSKRKLLESNGWKVGSAEELVHLKSLALTPDECIKRICLYGNIPNKGKGLLDLIKDDKSGE